MEEYFPDPGFHQNRTWDSGNVDGIRDLTARFGKKTLFAIAVTEVREAGFSSQRFRAWDRIPPFQTLEIHVRIHERLQMSHFHYNNMD